MRDSLSGRDGEGAIRSPVPIAVDIDIDADIDLPGAAMGQREGLAVISGHQVGADDELVRFTVDHAVGGGAADALRAGGDVCEGGRYRMLNT